MILIWLLFLCAFALSGAAAFYSIAGLMAIFAAAPIPIAIMGTTLEASKLVVASWLYRNWKDVPGLLKGYLTAALFVLMFLTSMGIFGYLSKAHLDQGVPTSDVAAKVALIDEKIKTEKENVDASRKAIAQLDEQVNQTLARTATQSNDAGVNRSVAIRRAQTKERNQLASEIEKAQAAIAALNNQRAPIAAELRKVEAEVGPIKYIAQLIYGRQAAQDTTILEKAVQWVTVLIVIVFDPLAVVLLIGANWSLVHRKRQDVGPIQGGRGSDEDTPATVVDDSAGVDLPEETAAQSSHEPPAPVQDRDSPEHSVIEGHPYLTTPFAHFNNPKPRVAEPQQHAHPSIEPDTQSVAQSSPSSPEEDYIPFWRSRPRR